MTRKAMLDKSGAYSKVSAKAELNLQLRMTLQLHAALLEICHFYVPNICQCTKYLNLQIAIEQCWCEGILTELRELEQQQKAK